MRRNQVEAIQNYQEHIGMLLCPENIQLDQAALKQTFSTERNMAPKSEAEYLARRQILDTLPHEVPFPSAGERGEWKCTVCGHWNDGSVDDGCDHCG